MCFITRSEKNAFKPYYKRDSKNPASSESIPKRFILIKAIFILIGKKSVSLFGAFWGYG